MSGNVELGTAMSIIHLAAITFTALFVSTVGALADGTWCANYKNGGTIAVSIRFRQGASTFWFREIATNVSELFRSFKKTPFPGLALFIWS
jgi:hypothetical protein